MNHCCQYIENSILVGYNDETICCVYLHNKAIFIFIKELKIYKNADEKNHSQVRSYDTMIALGSNKSHPISTPSSLSASLLPPIISTLLPFVSEITPITNIPKNPRSERILQPPKRYDVRMNNDIKVLLSQLIEVLDVPDKSINENFPLYSFQINDECELLLYLILKIRSEDIGDLEDYAYIRNNFYFKESETYEKTMASKQAEEWAEAMKKEIKSLITHETWALTPKNNIAEGKCALKRKWVYKITKCVKNQITQFKARWVVKGYFQLEGKDFD